MYEAKCSFLMREKMSQLTNDDKKVLKEHYRPIVHMRRQFEAGKLVLVFGTGLTQPLGIPGWNKLNDMIASDSRVLGCGMLGRPTAEKIHEFLDTAGKKRIRTQILGPGPEETFTTQKLYEHFKRKQSKKLVERHTPIFVDAKVYYEWKTIVRDQLYKRATKETAILGKHAYLRDFLPIIQNTPLTITFNLDDVIEATLYHTGPREGRGYETVTDIRVLPRRKSAVIYHPNGYIPRESMEENTQEIVLSESEFANRMAELSSGQYSSLLHTLSRNTCLFIGLSLRDGILKNLLKQSAMIAPGNYHYYVDYCDGRSKPRPCAEDYKSIRASNFDTYNLITLCMNDAQISLLGKMIRCGFEEPERMWTHDEFGHAAEAAGVADTDLSYYIVGAIGAGKSTCVSFLRSLTTFDEWFERRKSVLAKNWTKLSPEERKEADDWIAGQFKQKNLELLDKKCCISISDRCPLDPISFTDPKEWSEKAKSLLQKIDPERVKSGHVIFLWHDPALLALRAARTEKRDYDEESLKQLQDSMQKAYDMRGVTRVDCRFLSFYEVMKSVCRIIHMSDEYEPADIHARLEDIRKGEVVANDLFQS